MNEYGLCCTVNDTQCICSYGCAGCRCRCAGCTCGLITMRRIGDAAQAAPESREMVA